MIDVDGQVRPRHRSIRSTVARRREADVQGK